VVEGDEEGVVEGGGGGAEGDCVYEDVVEKTRVKLRVGGGEDDGEDKDDFEEGGEFTEDAGWKRSIA